MPQARGLSRQARCAAAPFAGLPAAWVPQRRCEYPRENMNNFIRPPVFYPASVVFVDDNDSYLDALRRFFPDTATNLFFTRPQTALPYIRQHARENSLELAPAAVCLSEPGVERFVETSAGRDVVARPSRFQEVAAVVVDYDMPGMSG